MSIPSATNNGSLHSQLFPRFAGSDIPSWGAMADFHIQHGGVPLPGLGVGGTVQNQQSWIDGKIIQTSSIWW